MGPIHVKDSDICCICRVPFLTKNEHNELDECVQLACQHIFHENCLNDWRRQASNCPICRRVIASSQNSDRLGITVLKTCLVFICCWSGSYLSEYYTRYGYRSIFELSHFICLSSLIVVSFLVVMDWNPKAQEETEVIRKSLPDLRID